MDCIAPNVCLCKNSQFKNVNGTCEPKCEFGDDRSGCVNAICIKPKKCECFHGYNKISESTCQPVCTNCENGECVGPEQCKCHEGYSNYVNESGDKSECRPICENECINSLCVRPNICECANENFSQISENECASNEDLKCNCPNGTCIGGECVCNAQFELIDGKCAKVCNKTCENGRCFDDKCICSEGYKLSEDGSRCDPVCVSEDGHDCMCFLLLRNNRL